MNQQHDLEDDIQTQPLSDLPLSAEEAETAKAGAHGGGAGAGKVIVADLSL